MSKQIKISDKIYGRLKEYQGESFSAKIDNLMNDMDFMNHMLEERMKLLVKIHRNVEQIPTNKADSVKIDYEELANLIAEKVANKLRRI